MILPDNSTLNGKKAEKIDDNNYKLNNASYTSCSHCKNIAPKWLLNAKEIEFSKDSETITYKNLFLNIKGQPIFYTPYFRHPTPNAKAKSGILRPRFGIDSYFGSMFELPIYLNLSNDKDVTYKPIFTSKQGLINTLEFRNLSKEGLFKFFATNNYNKNHIHKFRYHIDSSAHLSFNSNINYGFNIKQASDQSYLREFKFGKEEFLTSDIYFNYYNLHDYVKVKSLSFQNLRPAPSDSLDVHGLNDTPIIFPLIKTHFEMQPANSNITLAMENSLLSYQGKNTTKYFDGKITNDGEITRATTKLIASLPINTDNGQKISLTSSLRGDIFSYNNFIGNDVNTKQRLIPEVKVNWQYPLAKLSGNSLWTIEPIIETIFTPSKNYNHSIINRDSKFMDLNEINLFTDTHYSGQDLIEIGPRVNYGIKTSYHDLNDQYASLLFGQSYKLKEQPLTSNKYYSDFIGNLTWNKGTDLYLGYKFRLNKKSLALNYNEVNLLKNSDKFWLKGEYINYKIEEEIDKKKELFAEFGLNIFQNWKFSINSRLNLSKKIKDDNNLIAAEGKLTYHDDCFTISTSVMKDYTILKNYKPVTSFWINIELKNIN